MKILHTSDWHLGRSLYGRKRYEEFSQFLNWLLKTIYQQQVDILLVAGDIFDTGNPANRAQELYYHFLSHLAKTPCRHVVVIAGNHDSPTFLEAPKTLLKVLDVHVVGAVREPLSDEVILLTGADGSPELLVCAVPYLRDRDIRWVTAGESLEAKDKKLLNGIRHHYQKVVAMAEKQRQDLSRSLPLIVMGHLFAAGGKTEESDGVRDLYVGSLAHVSAEIFPDCIDYLALGHLHVPQKVADSEFKRYSGSPIPMGFGEAKQQKIVCLVEFSDQPTTVTAINIPIFQQLEQIKGDWNHITSRITALANANAETWLEVIYEGQEVIGNLRQRLEAAVTGSKLEILRIKNRSIIDKALQQSYAAETHADLNCHDVFARCLDTRKVPEEQRPALLHAYGEVIQALDDADIYAE